MTDRNTDDVGRRRVLRGVAVAGVASTLAGCVGGGNGSNDETTDGSPGRHTTSEPPGTVTVGAASPYVGASTRVEVTIPATGDLSGDPLESLAVAFPGAFGLDLDRTSATGQVGTPGESATAVTVADLVGEGSTATLSFDGGFELSADHEIAVEFGDVVFPDRPGDYLVDVTVNGSVSDSGALGVFESADVVETGFDDATDGWRVVGDAQGSSAFPDHVAEGGDPGGHVSADDNTTGGIWYWAAPLRYRGDKSDYVGGGLSFSLRQSRTDSQFDAVDVAIVSPEGTLVYDFGGSDAHPGTEWTGFDVPLEAGGAWRVLPEVTALGDAKDQGVYDGAEAPDDSALRSILGAIEGLYVRGEYVSGSDVGDLDTVRLSPP